LLAAGEQMLVEPLDPVVVEVDVVQAGAVSEKALV